MNVKAEKVIKDAVRKAGSYAGGRAGEFATVERKRGFTDLVTDVDKKCESLVIETIKEAFPEDAILAEESGGEIKGDLPRRWIIDPLDGTTNFTHGFPFFCCSVALEENSHIVQGAVYEPIRDELFYASEGRGAELNGEPIHVSKRSDLKESLLGTGFAYDISGKADNIKYLERALSRVQAVRRPGAAALDLCYVASGRYEGFWELGLAPWDTAAGIIIVREAGGVVSGLRGEEYSIDGKNILASNGLIHSKLIETLFS